MTDDPIAVEGVLTAEDLRRDAHRRLRLPFALCALWVGLEVLNGVRHEASSYAVAVGVVLLVGLLEYRLRQASQQHPHVGQIWMELSDEGITSVTPVMSARQTWANFKGFRETPAAFLLHTGGHYEVLPKRFFADRAQVDAARSLLAQHLAGR